MTDESLQCENHLDVGVGGDEDVDGHDPALNVDVDVGVPAAQKQVCDGEEAQCLWHAHVHVHAHVHLGLFSSLQCPSNGGIIARVWRASLLHCHANLGWHARYAQS